MISLFGNFCLTLLFSRLTIASNAPDVELDYATLLGRENALDHSWEYLGIPFAQAGRFEHARLYNGSIGTFNANEYGAICPQHSVGAILTSSSSDETILGHVGSITGPAIGALIDSIYSFPANRSEDCLFVNVQVPQNTPPDAALPVIFWIHGGGFEVGSPTAALSETDILRAKLFNYNPGGLLRTSVELGQPVIMVSANHRLNAFGFSASREMEEAGLLNLGLEDQRVALQWVQQHIAAFGGDPSKVTLMGDSSGAWSTTAHMLWDGGDTQGLFRAAIAMSGGGVAVDGPERQQAAFDHMVETAGCTQASDKIQCLKEAKYEDIMTAVNQEGHLMGPRSLASTWTIRPDGKHLKDSPHRLVKNGQIARVPLMAGDMRDEGTFFSLLPQLETLTEEAFKSYFQSTWWPHATSAEIDRVAELYPQDPAAGSPFNTSDLWNVTPNFKRIAALIGDYSFEAQRRNLLEHHPGPAWNYVIDVDVPTAGLTESLALGESDGALARLLDATVEQATNIPILGSLHAWDCYFYVFAGLPTLLSKNTLYRQATILAFARDLDPNAHGLDIPHWPQFTKEGRETYNLRESGPRIERDDYRWEAMEYLNEHADSFVI